MRKRVQGNLRRLADEIPRKQMAHGRRLLEAVPGESACAPEAVEIVDRAQYGLMIWRHLVQACPGRAHAGITQRRRPALDDLGHGVEDGPIDFGVKLGVSSRNPMPKRRPSPSGWK